MNDDGYVVGVEDTRFLLDQLPNKINSSLGITVSIDYGTVADLDSSAIEEYRRKAIDKDRHSKSDVSVPDEQIISDLKLFDNSSGQLKRAAILLFHPDPEKYVTGAYVKIAFFAPEGAY